MDKPYADGAGARSAAQPSHPNVPAHREYVPCRPKCCERAARGAPDPLRVPIKCVKKKRCNAAKHRQECCLGDVAKAGEPNSVVIRVRSKDARKHREADECGADLGEELKNRFVRE